LGSNPLDYNNMVNKPNINSLISSYMLANGINTGDKVDKNSL